jgi:ATP-binding cassette subfamily C protein LapB
MKQPSATSTSKKTKLKQSTTPKKKKSSTKISVRKKTIVKNVSKTDTAQPHINPDVLAQEAVTEPRTNLDTSVKESITEPQINPDASVQEPVTESKISSDVSIQEKAPEKKVKTSSVEPQQQTKQIDSKNTPEDNWQFDVDTSRPYDPLLGCLTAIAKLKNKPSSVQSLTAGLPLVNYKLTPELLKRAANRIGLSAKTVRRKLKQIPRQDLPTILFLKHKQACVLTEIREDGQVVVIQPESGEGFIEMSWAELAKSYVGYAVFIQPIYRFNRQKLEPQNKSKQKKWFWGAITQAMPLYSEVVIASLLINIFTIASPLFIMNVYDRVVPNSAIETLWVLAIGVIIVFSFDFILRNLRTYFIDSAGKKIDTQISTRIFEQIMDLEMSARPKSVGSLSNTVYSFEAFRELITSATMAILVDIPFILLFLGLIVVLGGFVSLVPLIAIPLVLLSSFLIQIPINQLVQKSYQSSSEKQAILVESLSGVETLKSMRAEGLMQNRWEQMTNILTQLGIKLRTLSNVGLNFSMYMQHITLVAVVIAGVYNISSGKMTMGALIACTILTGRALSPVSQIAMLITQYKRSKKSLDSLDDIMHMPVEHPAEKTFLHRTKLNGEIEFRKVSFNYPEQCIPALTNTSFKIKQGEKVGIIGRTGSGKTTIEKLLMKFYPATSGTILIDGVEIQQLDPAELRYHIGYIPQDVILFQGTIRDNIVLGAPYVDDAIVLRAAKLSGVDSFVNQHPLGFDRQIYERGQNLSGGQRQAIAIARALLLDPKILAFDEPCNAMDDTTIAHFFTRLKQQLQHKTLVLVTHRASLLQLVDRLIVIEKGQIVLDGPKDEVIRRLNTKNKT